MEETHTTASSQLGKNPSPSDTDTDLDPRTSSGQTKDAPDQLEFNFSNLLLENPNLSWALEESEDSESVTITSPTPVTVIAKSPISVTSHDVEEPVAPTLMAPMRLAPMQAFSSAIPYTKARREDLFGTAITPSKIKTPKVPVLLKPSDTPFLASSSTSIEETKSPERRSRRSSRQSSRSSASMSPPGESPKVPSPRKQGDTAVLPIGSVSIEEAKSPKRRSRRSSRQSSRSSASMSPPVETPMISSQLKEIDTTFHPGGSSMVEKTKSPERLSRRLSLQTSQSSASMSHSESDPDIRALFEVPQSFRRHSHISPSRSVRTPMVPSPLKETDTTYHPAVEKSRSPERLSRRLSLQTSQSSASLSHSESDPDIRALFVVHQPSTRHSNILPLRRGSNSSDSFNRDLFQAASSTRILKSSEEKTPSLESRSTPEIDPDIRVYFQLSQSPTSTSPFRTDKTPTVLSPLKQKDSRLLPISTSSLEKSPEILRRRSSQQSSPSSASMSPPGIEHSPSRYDEPGMTDLDVKSAIFLAKHRSPIKLKKPRVEKPIYPLEIDPYAVGLVAMQEVLRDNARLMEELKRDKESMVWLVDKRKQCTCDVFKHPPSWSYLTIKDVHNYSFLLDCENLTMRKERVVASNSRDTLLVYNVPMERGHPWKLKAEQVLRFIDIEVGHGDQTIFNVLHYTQPSFRKIFLLVSRNRVMGIVVAEEIHWAHHILRDTSSYMELEEDPVPVKVGINRLWVHVSMRRQHLATMLCHIVGRLFYESETLADEQFAFNYISDSMLMFAKKFLKTLRVPLYIRLQ